MSKHKFKKGDIVKDADLDIFEKEGYLIVIGYGSYSDEVKSYSTKEKRFVLTDVTYLVKL